MKILKYPKVNKKMIYDNDYKVDYIFCLYINVIFMFFLVGFFRILYNYDFVKFQIGFTTWIIIYAISSFILPVLYITYMKNIIERRKNKLLKKYKSCVDCKNLIILNYKYYCCLFLKKKISKMTFIKSPYIGDSCWVGGYDYYEIYGNFKKAYKKCILLKYL